MRTSSYGKNKKPEKQKPQGVKKSVRYEMAPFYTEKTKNLKNKNPKELKKCQI